MRRRVDLRGGGGVGSRFGFSVEVFGFFGGGGAVFSIRF